MLWFAHTMHDPCILCRGAKPGPPSDESDDEPVVFTEADLIEGEEDAQR